MYVANKNMYSYYDKIEYIRSFKVSTRTEDKKSIWNSQLGKRHLFSQLKVAT